MVALKILFIHRTYAYRILSVKREVELFFLTVEENRILIGVVDTVL